MTATATAAADASVSLARKVTSFPRDPDRVAEDVPHAPDGVDEPGFPVGFGLASQVADVDLEGVGCGAEVIAPYLVEDEAAGEDPPGVEHELFQEEEFGPGELELP